MELFGALKLTPTANSAKIAVRQEKRRLEHCAKKASVKYSKVRRKIRFAAMRAEKILRDKEGSIYSAGAFDTEVQTESADTQVPLTIIEQS